MYEKAKQVAKGVAKEWLTTFLKMGEEVIQKVVPLYEFLNSGTDPWKMEQTISQYVEQIESKEQRCKNCEFIYQKNPFFLKDTWVCSQIQQSPLKVQPEGYCKLWKKIEGDK